MLAPVGWYQRKVLITALSGLLNGFAGEHCIAYESATESDRIAIVDWVLVPLDEGVISPGYAFVEGAVFRSVQPAVPVLADDVGLVAEYLPTSVMPGS